MALAFSAKAEARFRRLLSRYPNRQAALVPTLLLANEDFGYLSREAMDYVAQRLGLPETVVLSAATFYTMLRKRPVGRHHIEVCENVSCYLRGSDRILAHLKKRLGIGPGEVTADGLFSIETVQCLASCGTAPVIRLDGTYIEDVTIEKLDTLIDELTRIRDTTEAK